MVGLGGYYLVFFKFFDNFIYIWIELDLFGRIGVEIEFIFC